MPKTKRAKKTRLEKQYPVYLLAIALSAVMFVEGALFGIASGPNVRDALSILDMTGQVQEVAADLAVIGEPMVMVISGVYNFYQLAANEMIALFSNFDLNAFTAPYVAILDFYQVSSDEMYKMLDLSSILPMTL